MKNHLIVVLLPLAFSDVSFSQADVYARLDFLLGRWQGTGAGFGNEKSKVHTEVKRIMDGRYIKIESSSVFAPTESKPKGEKHIDWGIVSFDKQRKKIVYRQFNIEGYVNQYILNEALSTETKLVFETEIIENFVPGGRARWTIIRQGDDEIETVFDVSFPGKKFACFGINKLTKQSLR